MSDLRNAIVQKLIELKKVPEDCAPGLVWIRDKWSTRVEGILRDGFTLKESRLSLVEGKEIVAQVNIIS